MGGSPAAHVSWADIPTAQDGVLCGSLYQELLPNCFQAQMLYTFHLYKATISRVVPLGQGTQHAVGLGGGSFQLLLQEA